MHILKGIEEDTDEKLLKELWEEDGTPKGSDTTTTIPVQQSAISSTTTLAFTATKSKSDPNSLPPTTQLISSKFSKRSHLSSVEPQQTIDEETETDNDSKTPHNTYPSTINLNYTTTRRTTPSQTKTPVMRMGIGTGSSSYNTAITSRRMTQVAVEEKETKNGVIVLREQPYSTTTHIWIVVYVFIVSTASPASTSMVSNSSMVRKVMVYLKRNGTVRRVLSILKVSDGLNEYMVNEDIDVFSGDEDGCLQENSPLDYEDDIAGLGILNLCVRCKDYRRRDVSVEEIEVMGKVVNRVGHASSKEKLVVDGIEEERSTFEEYAQGPVCCVVL